MGSQPSAPDPMMSSMVQAQFYKDAAKEQQKMNMVSQTTPYGTLNWSEDPSAPGGYRATQTFNPEMQALFDSNVKGSTNAANTADTLLTANADQYSKPLDLGYDATAGRIADLQRKTLDPQWARQQNAFDQQMADRGLMPGSAGYDNSYRDFNTSKSDAYNNMFLNSWNMATQNALQQYNEPLNAFSALHSGGQIQQPGMGLTQTPQETIQAPDYMGMAQNNYNTQMKSHDAMMGGLFGLGGSMLGMMK